jgi:L-2,4-diaminobutyric acid acetyltransferase
MTVRHWMSSSHAHAIQFRSAQPSDGASLWHLVQQAGTLELNSAYFYLLFATDFGRTCLIAEEAGEVVGAVIGYHPPDQTETAFVWQVGVLPKLHGQGLGVELLKRWIALPANRSCRWVTATVAEDNAASQALFRRFAQESDTECRTQTHFTAARSNASPHPTTKESPLRPKCPILPRHPRSPPLRHTPFETVQESFHEQHF